MLPTVTIGTEVFYDISSIVSKDFKPRVRTDGLAFHHTVGQTEFPDRNANGTSMDEHIAHIKAINEYHIKVGYGGFGYNAIAFGDGSVYCVGKCGGQRAHVANHNHHLGGLAGAGDFSTKAPPLGLVGGAGRWFKAMWEEYRIDPPQKIMGHTAWADPAWATSCPGAAGLKALSDKIFPIAVALWEHDPLEDYHNQIRAKIRAALEPAVIAGDVDTIAKQIAWLTGGKLCG